MSASRWSPEEEIGSRFRLPAPTLAAAVGRSPPILFSHLRCDSPHHGRSTKPRAEDAFVVHVMMREVTGYRLWLDGRERAFASIECGGVLLSSLEARPFAQCESAFDVIRIYLTRATLDELADSAQLPRPDSLRASAQGAQDAILFHLAASLLPMFEEGATESQLLLDQIALACHVRLVEAYGGARPEIHNIQGGLAPWQERRAKDYIDANLSKSIRLDDVARACDLSPGHFARAFRKSTGRPPHRWLLERRVELAKTHLAGSALSLAQISSACGFSDTSHFSRVFSNLTGHTPMVWRRTRRS